MTKALLNVCVSGQSKRIRFSSFFALAVFPVDAIQLAPVEPTPTGIPIETTRFSRYLVGNVDHDSICKIDYNSPLAPLGHRLCFDVVENDHTSDERVRGGTKWCCIFNSVTFEWGGECNKYTVQCIVFQALRQRDMRKTISRAILIRIVMSKPTWAVVATVDEPPILVAAFVRHYLAIGASEVYIYLDRCTAQARELLGSIPECILTVCDEAYWTASSRGKRPQRHTGRQKHNANCAFSLTKCDWILHCDADEFVADGNTLVEELRGASEELQYMRIPNDERVHVPGEAGSHIFEGAFRRKMRFYDELGEGIYGSYAKFLRLGMTGHVVGKAIARTNAPARMGIHAVYNSVSENALVHKKCSEARLLHFDGLTPLHFGIKLTLRASQQYSGSPPPRGEQRNAQINYVCENIGHTDAMMDFIRGVQFLTQQQIAILTALGSFDPVQFMPKGCEDLDLSIANFDGQLRDVHSELIAASGLRLP